MSGLAVQFALRAKVAHDLVFYVRPPADPVLISLVAPDAGRGEPTRA